jgi:outer membrane protein assembly factor BamD (BamD/ComL family)
MTISRRFSILSVICAAALGLLASCSSGPVVIPEGLSAAEIFQRAQDASDKNDYPLAMRYYSLVQTSYPDDLTHATWATYEIAFLYHKMGKDEMSLSLTNDLLDKYAKDAGGLPPAPRILAQKLKARLEETAKKTQ